MNSVTAVFLSVLFLLPGFVLGNLKSELTTSGVISLLGYLCSFLLQRLLDCILIGFLFYASTKCRVAGNIQFLSCSSVRAFVRVSLCASRNIVNAISCIVFDTFSANLRQSCIMSIM